MLEIIDTEEIRKTILLLVKTLYANQIPKEVGAAAMSCLLLSLKNEGVEVVNMSFDNSEVN